MRDLKGKLITFEGIDRAGKTSVVRLLPGYLQDCRVPIQICGELQSPLASIIQKLLTSGGSPFLKTFLFAADRAWTYQRVCIPALERGELVLWDRYVDSAIVYRFVELTKEPSEIVDLKFVRDINRVFKPPDLTIYIDISVDTSFQRAKAIRAQTLYNRDFLERVRERYLSIAKNSGSRYVVINGEQPLKNVVETVAQVIRIRFKEVFQ